MTFPCTGWIIRDTAKGREYQEVIVRSRTGSGRSYRFEAIVETTMPNRGGRRIQPGGESSVRATALTFRPPKPYRETTVMI